MSGYLYFDRTGHKEVDDIISMIEQAGDAHMQSQPWFVSTDDYKQWAKDKHPRTNVFAYLDFVKERDHETRLEF